MDLEEKDLQKVNEIESFETFLFHEKYLDMSRANMLKHREHKEITIRKSKHYGTSNEILIVYHSCGCQRVVYTPTGMTWLFSKKESRIRFHFVRIMIQRINALVWLRG